MLNLIRYYIWMYLEVVSRTPDMDDNDGYLSECIHDWDCCCIFINLWTLASCL